MRARLGMTLVMALVLCFAATAQAQRQGGGGQRGPGGFGGGFGGPGGGMGRLMLLRIEAVQKELNLTADQIAAIQKLQEELTPLRGGRGGPPGGQPGQGRGQRRGAAPKDDTSSTELDRLNNSAQFILVQNQPAPGGRRGAPTEEELQRMRQAMEERVKKEKEGLAKILKPEQLKRLNEIFIRIQGANALNDPDVAKELEISDSQKEQLAKLRQENAEKMREAFAGGGGGGGEEARAKLAELRKSSEEKTMAVLTDAQKKKFESLKGAPFELPQGALRGGFGGRGGAGGRGGQRGQNQ